MKNNAQGEKEEWVHDFNVLHPYFNMKNDK